MKITFFKYQGAGNDFVMIDQREQQWLSRADTRTIAHLCDRRYGIGADGLILLQTSSGFDFEMIYFNADGRESTMCGNGGRCIAAFAKHLGITDTYCRFLAIDGPHQAHLTQTFAPGAEWVELQMTDVARVEHTDNAFILNTGSPHYVCFTDEIDRLDMQQEGRAVRYNDRFRQDGINVNFASGSLESLAVRTYERGVEAETLACGTGVTAAAIAAFLQSGLSAGQIEIPVKARGGEMSVRFQANPDGSFSDIWLCGPAARVFSGSIEV